MELHLTSTLPGIIVAQRSRNADEIGEALYMAMSEDQELAIAVISAVLNYCHQRNISLGDLEIQRDASIIAGMKTCQFIPHPHKK